jgi:hypothetical protein
MCRDFLSRVSIFLRSIELRFATGKRAEEKKVERVADVAESGLRHDVDVRL